MLGNITLTLKCDKMEGEEDEDDTSELLIPEQTSGAQSNGGAGTASTDWCWCCR